MTSRRLSVLKAHLEPNATVAKQRDDDQKRVIKIKEIENGNVAIVTIAGSMDGVPKFNQDACVFQPNNNSLCLCDGHGNFGELVSDIVTKCITKNSQQNEYANDPVKLAEAAQQAVRDNLGQAAEYSGSTGVWAVLSEDKKTLRVSNVGDSRCIVVDDAWNIIFETKDHKPDDPEELERLRKVGGRVTKRPGGVARIAGLALSRAFGDFAATPHGVTAIPDTTILSLEEKKPAFVMLVSDGVIDAMSSTQVVEYLRKQRQAGVKLPLALATLVKACEEQWAIDTNEEYCDDITCAVWLL